MISLLSTHRLFRAKDIQSCAQDPHSREDGCQRRSQATPLMAMNLRTLGGREQTGLLKGEDHEKTLKKEPDGCTVQCGHLSSYQATSQ